MRNLAWALSCTFFAAAPPALAAGASGAALYQQHCVACHQAAGAGAPGLAPPLTANVAARSATSQGRGYLARVVVHGLSGRIQVEGVDYNGVMPAQSQLDDEDVAAVLGYAAGGFKGDTGSPQVSAAEVAAARAAKTSPKELRALREATQPAR